MFESVVELGQHGLFAVAKARLALDLEDRRDRHSELALELGIGVDEGLGEAPRQLAPERRFARARQPDQKQIAPMQMHPRIVVDPRWPNERPARGFSSASTNPPPRATRVTPGRRAMGPSLEGVDRILDDARRQEDEELLLVARAPGGLEQVAQERKVAQERHLFDGIGDGLFVDAADDRRVAVVDRDLRQSRCGCRSTGMKPPPRWAPAGRPNPCGSRRS